MGETGKQQNVQQVSGTLPEGFRFVDDGEVIPSGSYITRMDLTLNRTITNAPKASTPPSAPPKAKTEEVDVSRLTQEDPNLISVQWGDEKDDGLMSGPTRPVPSQPKPTVTSSATQIPPVDQGKFKFGISVVVMVLDFILSNILAKIAGDGEKPTAYTADKTGRETFEESLCLLLDTKKELIPNWLIVLLAFASAWGFQVMAAIQTRQQKGKPVTERKENGNDPLKEGLFIGTDGKVYRRYKNGSVRPAQFDLSGNEKVIGQPARRRAA